MNLTEYRAKREVIEQMVERFKFIVPGCAQCKHFDSSAMTGVPSLPARRALNSPAEQKARHPPHLPQMPFSCTSATRSAKPLTSVVMP